jgi:hypothetical protein
VGCEFGEFVDGHLKIAKRILDGLKETRNTRKVAGSWVSPHLEVGLLHARDGPLDVLAARLEVREVGTLRKVI